MEGFLYRLRRGSAARELIRLLSLERKTGPSFGSPHLDIGPPGTGDGAATAPNNAEISVLISVNDTLAHRDRRAGRSLTRRQKKLVAAAHTSKSAAIQLEAARADPRWMNSDQAQFSSSGTAPDDAGTPPGDQPHEGRAWIGRDRRTRRTGDGQSFQGKYSETAWRVRAGCGAGDDPRHVVRDLRLLTVFAVLRAGYGGRCPGFGGC